MSKPTTHTAKSYAAKYKGAGHKTLGFLKRQARMLRREKGKSA